MTIVGLLRKKYAVLTNVEISDSAEPIFDFNAVKSIKIE